VLLEVVGEVEQFADVAGQTGKLRENEARDVPRTDVSKHPLGFRVIDNRLPAPVFQVVNLDHCPALCLSVEAGAAFVVLRAFTLHLILS
jgi:hypothetical protein